MSLWKQLMSKQLLTAALVLVVAIDAAAQGDFSSVKSIHVDPAEVTLQDQQQLLVSGKLSDAKQGETADFTGQATYESSDPKIATVSPKGLITPRSLGKVQIRVRLGPLEKQVAITVTSPARDVEFNTDVIGALSRAGCNQGACHGSPQGKSGFRLSLRGFDPALDFNSIVRGSFGRRTNVVHPARSLVLRKALGQVPHQGGIRFKTTDSAYLTLKNWIDQGCRPSEKSRNLAQLEVIPSARRLPASHPRQQIIALAHFDDGTIRDVTRLAVFTSNNQDAATVTREGLVEFQRTAESSLLVRYLDKIVSSRLTYVRRDPKFVFRNPKQMNYVDEHIFAQQRELQIQPAEKSSDAVFLRRVSLDVIGTLPTAEEARAFLDSKDSNKRSKLIDQLLQRDEYAAFWALKWADIMRGSDVTISRRGVFSFHRYLKKQFAQDRPFDQFAKEILTGLGSTLDNPPANFFRVCRTPDVMAEAMSQLFLGVRIGCAKCHNHPFESITQSDYYGFAAYFSRVKFKGTQFGLDDEIVYLSRRDEVRHPLTNQNVPPAAFGKAAGELSPDDDRREKLAEWLTSPDNRFFARSTVNRLWYHLLGRGIVEPVDDFRNTNPPSNPELLDALAADFAKQQYRIKPILRVILNSQTYQLSSQPAAKQSPNAADPASYFSHAQVRMLTGEQILDAISSATGIPARFKGYPYGTRAIDLAEGAVDHSFLQAFSKPVRDVTCECARDTDPSISQIIHLLNNPEISGNITSPKSRGNRWLKSGKSDSELLELIYLSTLSRRPNDTEKQLAARFLATIESREAGFADLQHALININEFLLRH
jgi:hypothetical protein